MQKVYKDPVVALSTTDFDPPANYDPQQFSCSGEPMLQVANDTLIENPIFDF
jgi:hypothetical protein